MLHMIPSCRAPTLETAHGSRGNSGRIAYTLGLLAVEKGGVSFLCLKEECMSVAGCRMYVCLGGDLYEIRSFLVNLTLSMTGGHF